MKKLLTTLLIIASIQCFAQQHYPIKNMLGVNVHQWDVWYYDFDPYKGSYDAKYKALINLHPSSIRVYVDADLTQDSSGNYAFNPTYRGGFETETGLKRIKASNPEIFIQACYQRQSIQTIVEWGANNSQINFPWKYNNDIDRLKPASYTRQSHDLAVLTTRGGRNLNAPGYNIYTNSSAPWTNNFVIKGQNFYDAVEDGNEWNAWWGNYNTNMSSAGMGAAWKNGYDSVKKIDPSMLFTNGGIAADVPDTFLKAIDYWKKNGYGIPVDYFSYHSYPSAMGLYGWGTFGGLNPEEILYPRAKAMVNALAPYMKPVVIGEWGYDVHPDSWQNAPAFGKYNAEQTRAWWSVRALLKFSQAGIWRAQWYRAYQDWPNSIYDKDATQYATMALLRQYNQEGTIIKRTLVGDCFKQMNLFGDYVFDKVIREDSVQHLQLKGAQIMQALWSVETYKIVNNRPVFTERKIKYNLPSGTVYGLNEDSSGVMFSYHRNAGDTVLTSKPLFFVPDLTSLPVKDKPKEQKPNPNHHYYYELFNSIGQKVSYGQTFDIELKKRQIKVDMNVTDMYFIKYWDNKNSYTDKIFKQ